MSEAESCNAVSPNLIRIPQVCVARMSRPVLRDPSPERLSRSSHSWHIYSVSIVPPTGGSERKHWYLLDWDAFKGCFASPLRDSLKSLSSPVCIGVKSD